MHAFKVYEPGLHHIAINAGSKQHVDGALKIVEDATRWARRISFCGRGLLCLPFSRPRQSEVRSCAYACSQQVTIDEKEGHDVWIVFTPAKVVSWNNERLDDNDHKDEEHKEQE